VTETRVGPQDAPGTEPEMDAPEMDAPEAAAPEMDAPEAAAPAEAATAVAEPESAPAPRSRSRKAAPKPEAEAPAPAARRTPAAPAAAHGLRARYADDVVPALTKQFEYGNPNEVPRLSKIVVNVGLGEALANAKAIEAASGDLTMITGQKPIVTRARRSIAQFRVRTGNPIGLKVTLRGQRMWDFLERLTMLALPRIRDFRGIPGRSFDGRGNYSLGLREQIAFPEIDYDKVDRLRGLEVSIVTTAKTDEESKRLLELLGMPFAS
jgi:large subunit ribosomal protein L5